MHGSALLKDVSESLGVSLNSEEYKTFNGLIFHALESILEDGSDIVVEIAGLKIEVTKIVKHQVETAVVRLGK